jgi:hypothetical protein
MSVNGIIIFCFVSMTQYKERKKERKEKVQRKKIITNHSFCVGYKRYTLDVFVFFFILLLLLLFLLIL